MPVNAPRNVLVVEDNQGDFRLVVEALREAQAQHLQLVHVTCLSEALDTLASADVDVILLDLSLPDSRGLQSLSRVSEVAPQTPIVVLTGLSDEELGIAAVQAGAQDYLVKGEVTGAVLVNAIRYAIERTSILQTVRKHEEELRYAAFHDALTGLSNRTYFMEQLGRALELVRRYDERGVALLFLDLDNFKIINDSLGHECGDLLLIAVARRLRESLRTSDLIARFGGDEFTILLEGVTSPSDAEHMASRIGQAMEPAFLLAGRSFILTASIGIATSSMEEGGADDLMRAADVAMYRAKAHGKARFALFEPTMAMQAMERLELEQDLRQALEDGALDLAYQPVIDFVTGEIASVEVLARWKHPRFGAISPGAFIPVAEETGLIVELGAWVLSEACRQMERWRVLHPSLQLNVNISIRETYDPKAYMARFRDIVGRTGIEPSALTFEVTESALVDDYAPVVELLQSLRADGARIAIDDFGTGHSSLSKLHQLPLDVLKIDRSFVWQLDAVDGRPAIVRALKVLADALGLATVAEGVETEQQSRVLQEIGCDFGQGFLFGRPNSAAALTRALTTSGWDSRCPASLESRPLPAVITN